VIAVAKLTLQRPIGGALHSALVSEDRWGEAPDRPITGCEELGPLELAASVRPIDAPSRGSACCSYIWYGLEKC